MTRISMIYEDFIRVIHTNPHHQRAICEYQYRY